MSGDESASNEVPPQDIVLARRLKEAREFLGLSQEIVAAKVGLPRPAISAVEGAKRKVSVAELKKFAELYRRSTAFFLQDDPSEEDETVNALFRAAKDLNDVDRLQVLRFAEFLKGAGSPPTKKNG